uniref:Uncharacterized protein n=1 Tax=Anopheles quadriannulatus TaxID=34691 RepID=A0A182XS74_ANOQN
PPVITTRLGVVVPLAKQPPLLFFLFADLCKRHFCGSPCPELFCYAVRAKCSLCVINRLNLVRCAFSSVTVCTGRAEKCTVCCVVVLLQLTSTKLCGASRGGDFITHRPEQELLKNSAKKKKKNISSVKSKGKACERRKATSCESSVPLQPGRLCIRRIDERSGR